MTELPQSFYKPALHEQQSRRSLGGLTALLAVLSGWFLFGLPGTPIHRLRLPEDLPHFGVGLAQLDVSPEGLWVIRRQYYADRMGRYELTPEGKLTKHRGALREVRGWEDLEDLQMAEGHTLKVRPSRSYYLERQEFRRQHADVPELQSNEPQKPEHRAIEQAVAAKQWKDPYVIVLTYGEEGPRANLILQGHSYYEVLDAASFRYPNLWLTTDRLKHLHRVTATDVGGEVVVQVEQTVPLDLGAAVETDSKLGFDKHRGELFLVLPNGQRHWYKPDTLEHLRTDQLPGQWEREFATVGFVKEREGYPSYAPGQGYALTERGYNRLMRVLAVVFIASLILLALELTRAWRSTSERTTAATS